MIKGCQTKGRANSRHYRVWIRAVVAVLAVGLSVIQLVYLDRVASRTGRS